MRETEGQRIPRPLQNRLTGRGDPNAEGEADASVRRTSRRRCLHVRIGKWTMKF